MPENKNYKPIIVSKYDEFLSNEVRYNSLKIKDENLAKELLKINKDNAIKSIKLADAIPTGSTSTDVEKCLELTYADDTTVINISIN